MFNINRRSIPGILGVLLLSVAGCGSDSPTGLNATDGQRYNLAVGSELQLRLQSIGPGQYVSPPLLSSGALRFVGVELVGPAVPAGITQLFSFMGATPGTVVVTFLHTGNSATIIDTVVVQ